MQRKMNIPLDSFFARDFKAKENDSSPPPKKNRGGRPKQINIDQVLTRRDQLIQILSFAWGEIGWELNTAQTCEDVSAAFACLKGQVHSNELYLFWRVATVPASAREIRETKKNRGQVVSAIYKLTEAREPLADKLRRSSWTLKQKADNENLQALLEEFFRRMVAYRKVAHDLDRAEKQLKDIEIKLQEQEASYAQTELLKFIHTGKYEHNPRNIAQAMAGLPSVSCSYSFQECAKNPSPLWPTRPDEIPTLSYRIFQLIEECCNRSKKEPGKSLVNIVQERARMIPAFNALRISLQPDWRYLRRAVEETDLTGLVSDVVLYRIFAAFIKLRDQHRSAEESTLAEIESTHI